MAEAKQKEFVKPAPDELVRKMESAESAIRVHAAMLPRGVYTQADIVNPLLWVNVAQRCRVGDEIIARNAELTVYARLCVTYAQGSDLRLWVLQYVQMEAVADVEDASGRYETKMRGLKRWCVIDKSTGAVVFEDIPTKVEAMQRLADHERALSR